MHSHKHERTTFGAGDRFAATPEPRPAFYKGFAPLSHAAQGRATSPVGTFTTGPKGKLFDVEVNDVPFRCADAPLSPPHSRGVKRTAPRFYTPDEEGSPGPIYKPYDAHPVPTLKFATAARFSDAAGRKDESNGVVVRRKKLSEYINEARNEHTPRKGENQCSFGIRHAHLEQKPVTSNAEPLGPENPLKRIPEYTGKFGTSDRKPDLLLPSSSTGSQAKIQTVVDTPQWTIGRRRKLAVSSTPGPGAYNVEKYKPFSKPNRPTFTRTVHDGKIFTLVGRDSPGPAVYSTVALPKVW